jgi:uncharacterized membrane protein
MLLMMSQSVYAASDSVVQMTPEINAIRGESIVYDVLLSNESATDHQISMVVEDSNSAYSPVLLQDNKVVTTIELASSSKLTVALQVTVPDNLSEGHTVIHLKLSDELGTIYDYPISIRISNDYALDITNQITNAQVISGKSFELQVEVTNTGALALETIKVEGNLPRKWVIESSSPEKVSLQSGETGTFNLKVFVPSSQTSGKSDVEFVAVSDHVSSEPLIIPVTVSTNQSFGMFAMVLIILAGLGTWFYFRKHGRR